MKLILFILIYFFLSVSIVVGEPYSKQQIESITPPRPLWTDNDFSWVGNEWHTSKTESEKSIVRNVQLVEQLLQSGKSVEQVKKNFNQKLNSNPKDAGYRVGWAYSAFLERYSSTENQSNDYRNQQIARADWLLHFLPKISVYELYRVRFLVSASRLSFDGTPLKKAAIKLSRKSPNDPYILLNQAYILASLSSSIDETNQALRLSDKLIADGFRIHMCYSAKGMAHWTRIIPEMSSKRAKLAIENYQQSYKYSTSDRGRENCTGAIERIKWACKNKGIKLD
jgi:hypothetical protein